MKVDLTSSQALPVFGLFIWLVFLIAIVGSSRKWRTVLFILKWSLVTAVVAGVAALIILQFILHPDDVAGTTGYATGLAFMWAIILFSAGVTWDNDKRNKERKKQTGEMLRSSDDPGAAKANVTERQ